MIAVGLSEIAKAAIGVVELSAISVGTTEVWTATVSTGVDPRSVGITVGSGGQVTATATVYSPTAVTLQQVVITSRRVGEESTATSTGNWQTYSNIPIAAGGTYTVPSSSITFSSSGDYYALVEWQIDGTWYNDIVTIQSFTVTTDTTSVVELFDDTTGVISTTNSNFNAVNGVDVTTSGDTGTWAYDSVGARLLTRVTARTLWAQLQLPAATNTLHLVADVNISANPTSNLDFMQILHEDGVSSERVRITSAGKLQILNGAAVVATSVNSIPLGVHIRIIAQLNLATSGGSMTAQFFSGTATSNATGDRATATNLTMGVSANRCRFGNVITALANLDHHYKRVGMSPSVAFGPLGGGGGTPETAPATPTGVSATATSSSSVSVGWTAVNGAATYEMLVDGTREITGITGTSFPDTGRTASTTYSYQVRARNAIGASPYSSAVTATTPAPSQTVPPVPTGLAVTGVTSSTIALNWNDSTGATTYELLVDGSRAITGLAVSAHTDTGRTAATTHSYQVRARNTAGASAYSSAVSGTTSGTVAPVTGAFLIGLTGDQIRAKSSSAAGFANVKSLADASFTPSMESNSSTSGGNAFCAGLMYQYYLNSNPTLANAYRTKIVNGWNTILGLTSFWIQSMIRQMPGWVLAADLVNHRTTAVMDFCDMIRYRTANVEGSGRWVYGIKETASDSTNNHGTLAMGALAVLSRFVADTTEVNHAVKLFKGYLGVMPPDGWQRHPAGTNMTVPATGYTFSGGEAYSRTWTNNNGAANWYPMGPSSALVSGIPLQKDGVVTDDISRDNKAYSLDSQNRPAPGGKGIQYTTTAMAGVCLAAVILEPVIGPSVWTMQNNAMRRWRDWLQRYGPWSDGRVETSFAYIHPGVGGWMDQLLNKKYGTSFSVPTTTGYSVTGFDWLL